MENNNNENRDYNAPADVNVVKDAPKINKNLTKITKEQANVDYIYKDKKMIVQDSRKLEASTKHTSNPD